MQKWFYQLLGEEFGPVSAAEIAQLVSDGILSPQDKTRPATSDQWSTVQSVLKGDGTNSDSALTTLQNIDEISLEEDLPDINAFALEGAENEDAAGFATYFTETLGQLMGPMTLEQLSQMVVSGVLSESDLIRNRESGNGIPAREHPQLRALFQSASSPASVTMEQNTSPDGTNTSIASEQMAAIQTPTTIPTEVKKSVATSTHSASEAGEKKKRPRRRSDKKQSTDKTSIEEERLLDELVADVLLSSDDSPQVTRPRQTNIQQSPSTESQQVAVPVLQAISAPVEQPPSPETKNTIQPPPPRELPKSSRSRSGSSLVNAKTILGLILSVAVIATAVYVAKTGISFAALSMDTLTPLQQFDRDYMAIAQKKLTEEEWKAFGNIVEPETRKIIQYIESLGADVDQATRNRRFAGIKLLQLVECEAADKKQRDEKHAAFVKLLASSQ